MKTKNIFYLLLTIICIVSATSCSGDDLCSTIDDKYVNASLINDESVKALNLTDKIYKVSNSDAKIFANSLNAHLPSSSKVRDIQAISTQGIDTLLYIVNYDDGWCLISGDKRTNPIIAESKTGSFSSNGKNENLSGWISSYVDELSAIRQNNIKTSSSDISTIKQETVNKNLSLWTKISPDNSKKSSIATRGSVEYKWAVVSYTYCDYEIVDTIVPHLIKTKWGQGDPWNNKLPIDLNNNRRCYTGCVAVSLAQIIYYMHYFKGKPNKLYHDISISKDNINGSTRDIGFSRANLVENSDRWNYMARKYYNSNTQYVGDLMLDIGNRLKMSYSGEGSGATISPSALSPYSLIYKQADYDYSTVKNELLNSRPVNITSLYEKNKSGHSWIIDGLVTIKRHFVTEKHFEYTENWMNEGEYYDTFDEIKARYNVNSEYDYVTEEGATSTYDYFLMNWGYNGSGDNAYYSTYPSSSWNIDNKNYKYSKKIYYGFE